MKKDRMTKLYNGLNGYELAALAFNGSVSLDKLEMERIVGAVQKRTYTMPDAAYMRRIEDIRFFAMSWGVEHWKQTAVRYMANTLSLLGEKNNGEWQRLFGCIKQAESRLLALENVLIAVCARVCVNPDSVRAWTGATPFSTLFDDIEPDMAYQTKIQADFEQVFYDDE